MKIEVDTIKIEMSAKEAEELRVELQETFKHWADAVNCAGGQADDSWLLRDHPNICKLLQVLNIKLPILGDDLPF